MFTCVTGKQTIHSSPISSEPPSLGGPYLTWDYFEDSHCVPQPGPDTPQGCTVFAGGLKGWWTPPLQLCQPKSNVMKRHPERQARGMDWMCPEWSGCSKRMASVVPTESRWCGGERASHAALWARPSQQTGARNAGPEAGGGATWKSVCRGQSEQRRELGNEVRGTGARAGWHPRKVPEWRSYRV